MRAQSAAILSELNRRRELEAGRRCRWSSPTAAPSTISTRTRAPTTRTSASATTSGGAVRRLHGEALLRGVGLVCVCVCVCVYVCDARQHCADPVGTVSSAMFWGALVVVWIGAAVDCLAACVCMFLYRPCIRSHAVSKNPG